MSKAEIIETGYKWYRVKVSLTAEEAGRAPVDLFRYAGAQLRYAADGALAAEFRFRVADLHGGAGMVRLLSCFGEKGYFDEGRDIRGFFVQKSESDGVQAEAWLKNSDRLRECAETLSGLVARCLQAKRSRIETLRAVRAVLGSAVSEAEVRHLLEAELQRRYQSEIFGMTVLHRLGWPDARMVPVAAKAKTDARAVG